MAENDDSDSSMDRHEYSFEEYMRAKYAAMQRNSNIDDAVQYDDGEYDDDEDDDEDDDDDDDDDDEYDDDEDDDEYDDDEEDDDDDDGVASIDMIKVKVDAVINEIAKLELILSDDQDDLITIRSSNTSLAKLYGFCEQLQSIIDNYAVTNEDERTKRRELITTVDLCIDKIIALSEKQTALLNTVALNKKNEGNTYFAAQSFREAIKSYSEAIAIDPSNALFYTNRALAYQKNNNWDYAIKDAKSAIKLDVDLLKAYVILIKCHIHLSNPLIAYEAILSAPYALQSKKEIEELKVKTASVAKEVGNNYLKENKLEIALDHYNVACEMDDKNPIYFSNRSATHQARKNWNEAVKDGKRVIELDNQFGKGYLHVCRSLIQLKNFSEATEYSNKAKSILTPENLAVIEKSLKEIATDIANMGIRRPIYDDSMNATKRAEKFKEDGNKFYKLGEYQDAIRLFSQAIAANPKEPAYLGNRAACWMMLAQFKRCIEDCDEGLKLEEAAGSLDKIRVRKINAIIGYGKIEDAKKYILDIQASRSENTPKTTGPDSWESLLEKVEKLKTLYEQAALALKNGEFSRTKRIVQTILSSGVIDDPNLNLLSAKVHLELGEHREASEKAQKVIGGQDSSGFIDAYLIRAEALMGLGLQEQASKHLSAALQLDPDNQTIVKKLKNTRMIISETTRIRAAIDDAINKRQYDDAIKFCFEGLNLDKSNKKLMAEFSLKRSRVYHTQAKQLHRLVVAEEDKMEEKKGKTEATWKKCLQDANTCLYYDTSLVAALLLKSDALISLSRFDEAVSELEAAMHTNLGDDMDAVKDKLKEAKFALKKSKRVCLYALLGVANKDMATEKEIKIAYKKSALKFHPDRHSSASEEKKKEAEAKFKQINSAFELFSDPQRKRLYDQGYDLDEIEQMIEQENQRAQYNQHYGGHGGHRRYY